MDRKLHWEKVYESRTLESFSWYQPIPEVAIHFLELFQVPRDARIIDVGGGDALFVDYLLDQGFTNITVLDISATAIERARRRLGAKAEQVEWIVSDIVDFKPSQTYDFWHDRAAFHFLTDFNDVKKYVMNAQDAISESGALVVGTFSENGPEKCSGIQIRQYSERGLTQVMESAFEKIECFETVHHTPAAAAQSFTCCGFKKRL
jgi:2-polyprenyl-3-methyl-5-hydroxy-6-metoxy-1,4-benzoquinol methylase